MKILFSFVLASATPVFADAEFRGNVRSLFAADTLHDDPVEHFFESNTRLFAEGKYSSGGLTLLGSALFRYSIAGPRDTHQDFDARLYEAYGRWAHNAWAVEAGERVLRWGVMEYLSPTDTINPHDYTQISDPEVEDTYLPVGLVRITYESRPVKIEAVYQPFFVPSKFDVVGTDAAVYRPSLTERLGLPFTDISPSLNDSNEQLLSVFGTQLPDDNPLHGEGGAKLSFIPQGIDLSVLYLIKRETLPAYDFSTGSFPSPPPGTYPRDQMAGATFRWATDSGVTFKAEALGMPKATFYTEQLQLLRKPFFRWAAGADYDVQLNHFFTLEYAQDRVFDASGFKLLGLDSVQHYISGAAVFNFDDRTYSLDFEATGIPNQGAYALKPKAIYRPTPSWELALGAQVWGGTNNSIFGLISNNDQLFVSGKYLF